ncbi:DUF6350 family protein [Aldersonia sp. NBC_00410]|uniref:cell division protein PerM n=1 Tax=Aldersonia sp. NBC_00410 TaxID=2975954 RepID=UPI00225152CE|nr:DUF6350 family protein [Aldersonia sp. NBC_00410]MCX5045595.1 DUF6350 family protein [Aldersonia sp. NBC_00410]
MSAVLDTEDSRVTRDPDGGRRGLPELSPERAKTLVVVAFRPALVALALVATLVVVSLVAANSDLTGAFGGIAGTWLGIHQVPLTIGDRTLGLLPLLPTIGVIWFVARTCERAVAGAKSPREIGAIAAAAIAGPLVCTLIALAVVADAAEVIPLDSPSALAALGWVALIHLIGVVAGLLHARWREIAMAARLPDWAVAGALAAVTALRRLVIAGAVLAVLSLLVHASTVLDGFDVVDGFTGVIGVFVLVVAYLPNVVISAAAFLLGAPVQTGTGSIGLFDVTGAEIPAFPLFAAVPTGPAAPWWAALLLVPAVLGGLLGRDCALACAHRIAAAQAALTAGALIGVAAVLAAAISGGTLGAFGMFGPQALWAGLCALGWFGVLGGLVALARGARPPRADGSDESPFAGDDSPIGVAAVDSAPPVIATPAPVDAELIGAPPQDEVDAEADTADIVDAEVVEMDLDQGRGQPGG